jgi:hypothetical protein
VGGADVEAEAAQSDGVKLGVEVDPDIGAVQLAGSQACGGRPAEGVKHCSRGWASRSDAAQWDVDRECGEVRLS